MRKRKFTFGRIIAFIIGFAVVFFLWGIIFAPDGSGSNVLLGLLLAVIAIYYATTGFGSLLDDYWFHGGSRERALTYRYALNTLSDIHTKISAWRKKKKRRGTKEEIVALETNLLQLQERLEDISKHWTRDKTTIEKQVSGLKKNIEHVEERANSVLGKSRHSEFLSGLPSLAVLILIALGFRAFIFEPFQIPSGSMIPTLLVGDHLFVSKLRYGIVNPFTKESSYLIRWATPQPGEVIVFEAPKYVPQNAGEAWIKRVIAGPGQTIKISDTVVYVDNKPYPHVSPEEMVTYLNFLGDGRTGIWRTEKAIETTEEIGDVRHQIYLNPIDSRYSFESEWPMYHMRKPGLKCTTRACRVDEGYLFVMGDNRGNSTDSRIWGALPVKMVKGKAIFVWMSVDGSKRIVRLGRFTLPSFRFSRWFSWIN